MSEYPAPDNGTWVKETTHMSGALSSYYLKIYPKSMRRGFTEGLRRYGAPLSHLKLRGVNGFIYQREVMVGEPEEPKGAPPPGWLLWLLMRLHPEFRARNNNWHKAMAGQLWRNDLEEWDKEYKPDSIQRNLALVDVEFSKLDDADLINHLNDCYSNLEEMIYRHHRYSVPSILPVGRYLSVTCGSGHVSYPEAIELLKGSTPVSAGAFQDQLDRLVTALKASGVTLEDLQAVAADGLVDHVRSISSEVSVCLGDYLRYAGSALVSGYTPLEKTVVETPNVIKQRLLQGYNSQIETEADEADEADEAGLSELVANVRSKLPEDIRPDFDFWLQEARNVNRLRDERGVYNDIWASGIARRGLLEAGRRLELNGVLTEAELVLDCSQEEVIALLRGESLSVASELAERRDQRTAVRIEDMPEYLGSPPSNEPPPLHLMPSGLRAATETVLAAMANVFDEGEDAEVVSSAEVLTLKGVAVSPGVYEGTARVISGPADFGLIQQGDVLITRNTSAAFNVVLASLGALVTDRGGLLSHAAIVSREYGIPGVVATKRATLEIPDGSRVQVDGDNGLVSLLS